MRGMTRYVLRPLRKQSLTKNATQDVQRGQNQKALVSWYHTLAHELAHNLVHPHNSEHEFYFSAISEQHMFGLAKLLGGNA